MVTHNKNDRTIAFYLCAKLDIGKGQMFQKAKPSSGSAIVECQLQPVRRKLSSIESVIGSDSLYRQQMYLLSSPAYVRLS